MAKKLWYFGNRENKWYLKYPKDVPDYKRTEGITTKEFKRLGPKMARELVEQPRLLISKKRLI